MEAFWTILGLLLLSAVSSWLKRRSQANSPTAEPGTDEPWPNIRPLKRDQGHTQPAPAPNKSFDWEEELRRLLEGESGTAKPAPLEPPVIIRPPAPPATPPPVIARTSPAPPKRTKTPLPAAEPAMITEAPLTHTQAPAHLAQADKVYKSASQISYRVGHHLQQIAELAPQDTSGRMHKQSEEVLAALEWLHHPQSARQAWVASQVFGPPKALENRGDSR